MKRQHTLLLVSVATIALAGCAQHDASTAKTEAQREAVELQKAEARIASLETTLAEKDRQLQSASTGSATAAVSGEASLFPPNPKVGECYARVLLPATFTTASEKVLKREASTRVEIIPAQYETAEERVVLKEASTRLEVIPAEYEEIQETVMVKPASKKIVEVPARYDTVTEQVIDTPAHTAWKRGPASSFGGSNVVDQKTTDTGEIMCLVEVPATYKTITRQVTVSPATTREVEIPAEYKTIARRTLKRPATTREVTVPAEYGTVTVTKVVRPAQERKIEIPAEYETLTSRRKMTEERLEWRSVLCEVNMTASNVAAIQKALNKTGHYQGPIDGIIGPLTLGAAKSYAEQKGLPAGDNYIAMEVVDSLGLKI